MGENFNTIQRRTLYLLEKLTNMSKNTSWEDKELAIEDEIAIIDIIEENIFLYLKVVDKNDEKVKQRWELKFDPSVMLKDFHRFLLLRDKRIRKEQKEDLYKKIEKMKGYSTDLQMRRDAEYFGEVAAGKLEQFEGGYNQALSEVQQLLKTKK